MDKKRREFIKKSLLMSLGFKFANAIDIFRGLESAREINRISAKYFGVMGDGLNDETDSINLAIEYISNNGGGELFFDDGVYLINKFVYTNVVGLMPVGIDLKKNVKIVGAGNKTIFKVGDSSNGRPFILFNCYLKENCGIFNLSIDGNQFNNRSLQTNLRYPRSIIRVAGSMCFSISNINIYNADVNNYVYIGQNVSRDYCNTIVNCNFMVSANNESNYDHSTIYLASVGTIIYGCKIQAVPMSSNNPTRELLQSSGIEIHASNIKVLNNIVTGYNYIGYISSQESIVNNVLIQGNYLSSANGLSWAGMKNPVSNLCIIDNKIEMYQPLSSKSFGHCAIIRYPKMAISSVNISNNTLFMNNFEDNKMSFLFIIHNSGDIVPMQNITIINNNIQTNQSILMIYNECTIDGFEIQHNNIKVLNKTKGIGILHFATPSFFHGRIERNYYEIVSGEADFYVLIYVSTSPKFMLYQYNTGSNKHVPELELYFNYFSHDDTSMYSIDSFVKFKSRPPRDGIWLKGQRLYNDKINDSNVLGWVCTEGGSPGVWKSF